MNIINYQFNLKSWLPSFIEKDKRTHFTCLIMFIYRRVTSCFKSISVNRILGETRLSSIAIIYIERSSANRILQVSMDRIIDDFAK